jgi:hypothetical protein
MEYMLLRDGSVKPFDNLAMHEDVMGAMADYDGIAYYWHNHTFNWNCITNTSPKVSNKQITYDELPVVIKLAAMLE